MPNCHRLSCVLFAVTLLITPTITPASADQRAARLAVPSPAPEHSGPKVTRHDPRSDPLFDAKEEYDRLGNPHSTTMVDWWPISGFTPQERGLIEQILNFAIKHDSYAKDVRIGDVTRTQHLNPKLGNVLSTTFKKVDVLWVPDKSLILPMSATNTPRQFHAEFNAQRLYAYFEYAKRMIAATRGMSEAERRELWEKELKAFLDELDKLSEKSKGWERRYADHILRGIAHNGVFPDTPIVMPQAGLLDNQSCGSRSGSRCTRITPIEAYFNLFDTRDNIQLAASRTAVTNTEVILERLYAAIVQGDTASSEVEGQLRALVGNLEAAMAGVSADLKRNAPKILGTRVDYLGAQLDAMLQFLSQVAQWQAAQQSLVTPPPVQRVESVVKSLGGTKVSVPDPQAAKGMAKVQAHAAGAAPVKQQAKAEKDKEKTQQVMQSGSQCEQVGGSLGSVGVHRMAAAIGRDVLAAPGGCTLGKAPPSGLEKSLEAAANGRNGGIDLRSLELRYLSDKPGDGQSMVNYAFAGKKAKTYAAQGLDVGLDNVTQASDAFFVWLSMRPDTYWVNLNPNEPDRVVDRKLGRTDAGRVMLRADLRMKKTVGELIHPDTKLGGRFWDRIRGDCLTFRNWIVPGQAKVYASGDELYIVDAPLKVMSEAAYLKADGVGEATACQMDQAIEDHNEAIYADLVLPRLERAVNKDKAYAALRRVYLSRVAAEWYRQRDRQRPTGYGPLIDSNDITRWQYKGGWTPKDTFDDYVNSYKNGEFNIKRQTRKGNYIYTKTYVYGGVDWTNLKFRSIDRATLEHAEPGLAARIGKAFNGQTADRDGDNVWIGGSVPVQSSDQPQTSGDLPPSAYLTILLALIIAIVTFTLRALRTR